MLKYVALVLCFSFIPLFTEAAIAAQKKSAIASQSSPVAEKVKTGFPVLLDEIEIFRVSSSPLASLTPEMRASIIQQNIHAFAAGTSDLNELKVMPSEEGLAIGNSEGILMLITRQDAEHYGSTVAELAQDVLKRLHNAASQYRSKHTWQIYGLGATFTLLSIIVLWQILYWNNRGLIWLNKKIHSLKLNWKAGIHLKEFEVISTVRVEKLILLVLKFLHLLVVLLSLYFFLPLILSFFPETRKVGATIFDYLLTPFETILHAIIDYIPNLFYIFVIVLITYYVLKLISYVFTLIEHGELQFESFYKDWARPTYQIIRFLLIITALISAYPYIPGSSSTAFKGVGLVLGAIISFASSSAISNIVAGIILTYTRAFKLKDRIKVGETTGDVVEKTLLVTRLMTPKQVIVTIPNSLVMGSQIINFSTSAAESQGVILHTSVTIGYDLAWQQVEALLIEAALSTESVLPQPPPFVLKTSLDDFYVSYEINVYTKAPEQMPLIYSNLHRNILEKFNAAGVEIMSPHYYSVRDGNASTVPSVLNADGYVPPVFNIRGNNG